MSIQKFKLDDGSEFTIDTNSAEFVTYENAARQIGIAKNDDSFFFARNLEYVRQTIFRPTYSELKLLNGGLIPINTSIPEGADYDVYPVLDSYGEADVVADFSDDIKTVEVSGNEYTNKIKSLATSYVYSKQDMRKDMMLGNVGRSVITNKALAARMALDQKIEKVLGFGLPNLGITGLFNNSNVPISAVAATGTGSTTTWSTKTAANILADVEQAINDMIDVSNGDEEPTHMLVDATNYHLIKKKALDNTYYSGRSILDYITDEYGLKVEWVQQLKNGFLNNTKSGFVLYKNSESKVEGVLPIRLMPHAPQIKNLATKNILEARCGGVRVFFPNSVSYNYGI